MREIAIASAGEGLGNDPRNLRVKIDGVVQEGVRGFRVQAHVRQDHVHGPAVAMTVAHWNTFAREQADRISGVYRLTIEVPVWVEFVHSQQEWEPSEVSGQELYAAFYESVQRRAEENPGMQAFASTLADPFAA